MKNGTFLIEDQIDITFLQECKIREEEQGIIKKVFNDESYELIVGPCCKDTKKPSAGVGCASTVGKSEVITLKHLTKDFEEAAKTGRVEKYLIDLGWEKMMQVFNIYGKAGGRKEDVAVTEALLEATKGEREAEQRRTKHTLPTMILGDFNEDPEKLQGIMTLVEEEGWIDVGLHADWWGGPPATTTCEARP